MTDIVMNYTVNPVLCGFKKLAKAFMASQERIGRARAARHLAAMGYYEEAKQVMLNK